MVCNWKDLTIDFIWNNQARKLQGLGEQSIQEATLKEVSKDCRQQQMLFYRG